MLRFFLASIILLSCQKRVDAACDNLGLMTAAYLCNTTIRACVIHNNVCNSVGAVLGSSIPSSGWTIYFSTTSYRCLAANTAQCTDLVYIRSQTITTQPTLFTLPYTSFWIYNFNTTFIPLPTTYRAMLQAPSAPTSNSTICTVLRIKGSSNTFTNIEFDATQCSGVPFVTSTGVAIYGAVNTTIGNTLMRNVAVGIIITPVGSTFGTLRIIGGIMLTGNLPSLVVIPSTQTGVIEVLPPTVYRILTFSVPPGVLISGADILDLAVLFNPSAAASFYTGRLLSATSSDMQTNSVDYNTYENPWYIFGIVAIISISLTLAIAGMHHVSRDVYQNNQKEPDEKSE